MGGGGKVEEYKIKVKKLKESCKSGREGTKSEKIGDVLEPMCLK